VPVIWILSTALLLPLHGRAELVDRIVAVVNEDIILHSELEHRMISINELLKQKNYPPERQQTVLKQQRELMLEQMIYTKLTDQLAGKYQIKISEKQVDATIERMKKINKLTDESMQRMLELDGLTMEDYRTSVREQLLRTRLVNLEVKSKIVITDKDVNAYYQANIDRYMGKTKYRLGHLLLKVPDLASEIERAAVMQRAKELHKRLLAGESFSELAKTFSEASTAVKGGELGVFEINLLTKQIQQAIHGLDTGQFTPVVETDQGYQIFIVKDVISAGVTTLEEARPEIVEKLYAEDVDLKYKAWLKTMREKAHVQILE
jgi:peptidyl-prolyl cis-trans isomerase SurA